MSAEALRDTFFAECEELIESLSEGLDTVARGEWDKETINAIFRAVHSIKGAAGAFGFDDLVTFAHRYETVLDLIRSDKLGIEPEILRLITRSSDNLAELVDASRVPGAPVPDATGALIDELEAVAKAAKSKGAPEPEFSFAPLAFAALDLPIAPVIGLEILFAPDAAFYLNGHEPAKFFKALARLGTLDIRCLTQKIPDLAQFDFEESYLEWSLILSDCDDESAVRDMFAFIGGLGRFEVTPIESQEGAAANVTDPSPTPDPAGSPVAQTWTNAADASPQAMISEPPVTAPKAPSQAPKTVAATLRVDPERVDRLINSVGELIIDHAVISQQLAASGVVASSEVMAALDDYRYLARDIQEAVMSIRAQPVKALFQRMGRVVREAAEATGKTVSFVTTGEATEIDKTMLERLADPLTHMLRNSVDHGIEAPAKRVAAGKSETGVVCLSAAHRSGAVVIEISDDGAGLNRPRILAKAIEKGLVSADAKLSESEIDALLFAPGFSTAENVTNLSGRGVGMDVVKTAITSLGGKVSIASTPGKGAVFTITLPLTLAVLDGMIVGVADETMVIPLASVVETIRPRQSDLHIIGPGEKVLSVRGSFVPVVDLGALLGLRKVSTRSKESAFILVEAAGSKIAVSVDAIWDQRQVVIKSLEGNYGAINGIAAATILGDGKIALIVDPDALAELAAQYRPVQEPETVEA